MHYIYRKNCLVVQYHHLLKNIELILVTSFSKHWSKLPDIRMSESMLSIQSNKLSDEHAFTLMILEGNRNYSNDAVIF